MLSYEQTPGDLFMALISNEQLPEDLFMALMVNEMNRALGHLCAHIG